MSLPCTVRSTLLTHILRVSKWPLTKHHLFRNSNTHWRVFFKVFYLFSEVPWYEVMRLTVYDNFHFFHIWEWHIIFCTAFIFPSLVPGDSINVQILSVFKWFCWKKKNMFNSSCLRHHSSKTTISWLLTTYCWQNNSKWSWGIIKPFVLLCSEGNSEKKAAAEQATLSQPFHQNRIYMCSF